MNPTANKTRQDFSYTLRAKIQKISSNFATKTNWRNFNPKTFQHPQLNIPIPHLPPIFHNYHIIHISDIHYGQWIATERLKGITTLINQTHPDAIVITGDFVSYRLDEKITEELTAQLKKLQAKDGVFAVLGNHDHWAGTKKIKTLLKKSNIKDLSNQIHIIKRKEFKLIFAGVDSVMLKKAQLETVIKKMPKKGPAILLAHEPDFASTSALTNRFNLQLSGHSHGGQFYIPKLGTPFRGPYALHYPHGLYKINNMTLFTNTGLGTNSYWLRINCPPQIATINLLKCTP
ncbi:MAG: metallophosphoesterase [Nitrososphaerota archaeon]|nr:metallophosphoesterase [Nitrososphaerota archaeon]